MFNSEEFLKTREMAEQLFYKKVNARYSKSHSLRCFKLKSKRLKSSNLISEMLVYLKMNMAVFQVLKTHIFHSFLKDRLNRKMDNFARMELKTRSEMQK